MERKQQKHTGVSSYRLVNIRAWGPGVGVKVEALERWEGCPAPVCDARPKGELSGLVYSAQQPIFQRERPRLGES